MLTFVAILLAVIEETSSAALAFRAGQVSMAADGMQEIVEFIQAIVWPAATLTIVYLLLPELKLFAANLAFRIRTDNFAFGPLSVAAPPLAAPLPSQVQLRKIKFRDYALSQVDPVKIQSIAEALGLPPSKSISSLRKPIVAQMNQLVSNDVDMDNFSNALKRITNQDF